MVKKQNLKKKSSLPSPGLIALIILFLSTLVFVLLIYKYKHNQLTSPLLISQFSQMENWMKDHFQYFHKKLSADKKPKNAVKPVHKEELAEQIHFEFYTALPNMQMKVPDAVIATQKPPAAKLSTKNIVVVKADELEQELKNHLQTKNYILQLGIFEKKDLANQFRKTLVSQGYSAKMVKTSLADKEVYRIQLGPFLQDQAKLVQKQLQKKGMNGIILLSRENSA